MATILLLGLTIILFTSVFFFTSQFGKAQTAAPTFFLASLAYFSSSSSQVATVSITHLTGSPLPGGNSPATTIYVISQRHPSLLPNPFSVGAGLPGSTVWSFGQTWTKNISTYAIVAPDNLTVEVISRGQLLFATTLSVTSAASPPSITQVRLVTVPSPPVHGSAFTYALSAYVVFTVPAGATVTANLTQLGGGSAQALSGSGSGAWTFSGSATVAAAGTRYVFLTATGGSGLQSSYEIPVGIN